MAKTNGKLLTRMFSTGPFARKERSDRDHRVFLVCCEALLDLDSVLTSSEPAVSSVVWKQIAILLDWSENREPIALAKRAVAALTQHVTSKIQILEALCNDDDEVEEREDDENGGSKRNPTTHVMFVAFYLTQLRAVLKVEKEQRRLMDEEGETDDGLDDFCASTCRDGSLGLCPPRGCSLCLGRPAALAPGWHHLARRRRVRRAGLARGL